MKTVCDLTLGDLRDALRRRRFAGERIDRLLLFDDLVGFVSADGTEAIPLDALAGFIAPPFDSPSSVVLLKAVRLHSSEMPQVAQGVRRAIIPGFDGVDVGDLLHLSGPRRDGVAIGLFVRVVEIAGDYALIEPASNYERKTERSSR